MFLKTCSNMADNIRNLGAKKKDKLDLIQGTTERLRHVP
jgi:hypothetical protein